MDTAPFCLVGLQTHHNGEMAVSFFISHLLGFLKEPR
jgi:hypothetical protein